MPFISIRTGLKIEESTKKEIIRELGEKIAIIPGKNAGNLMVEIQDGSYMSFAGVIPADCMYMDIRLFRTAPEEAKNEVISAFYQIVRESLGLPEDSVYITITEFDRWGLKGKYL